MPIHYQVHLLDLHAHLFAVKLSIAKPAANQLVSLPVWIAGSYLVREFSKNLQHLQVSQSQGRARLTQIDKCTWQVKCKAGQPLVLTYQIYAFDNSVRTAWLDTQRGFFNGTSLCLRVHGQEQQPHHMTICADNAPANWQVATALTAKQVNPQGFGNYLAADFDELVDSPVEIGSFWSGFFTACGVEHRFVVTGATASFDGARLLADTKTICETEINFWHCSSRPPHRHYLFMLNAVDNAYGGLEHRHSTALICKRADLPRINGSKTHSATDGYTSLLGLISHEYFHTWNVKRLRPVEFSNYDYSQENYTELLWFFEGFTSYYDDLLLCRAGLIDTETYLTLLAKTINQVRQTPGRYIQSVAQASFDAWVKYYRQDDNTANATISYYTKGALVALCLDLNLRQNGKTSLDAVMRALWLRCHGGPMTESDLLAVLAELSGQSFENQIANWVHHTGELPLKALLLLQGVAYEEEAAPLADQLGLRVNTDTGIHIKSVLRGSAAEQAGFAANDEWIGINVIQGDSAQGWRLNRLDDLSLYLGQRNTCQALIARDQRLITLPLALPASIKQVKLILHNAARARHWLAGKKKSKIIAIDA